MDFLLDPIFIIRIYFFWNPFSFALVFSVYFFTLNCLTRKYIFYLFFYLYREKLKKKEIRENKAINSAWNELLNYIGLILSNIRDIILFKDGIYSLTAFVEIFLFWIITKRINIIFYVLLAGNIILFYAPLEKKFPKFLFRVRMFIKEIIEGIICVLITLLPIKIGKN